MAAKIKDICSEQKELDVLPDKIVTAERPWPTSRRSLPNLALYAMRASEMAALPAELPKKGGVGAAHALGRAG